MNRLVFAAVALVALALTGTASAATGWTPAKAAAKVKATYTTVDAKAVAAIQEHINALVAGGASMDDPLIVDLLAQQKKAQHAAVVSTARCKGVAKLKARRYTKFHCTAVVVGTERTPPDRQFYTATLPVTLTVSGARFAVKTGWR